MKCPICKCKNIETIETRKRGRENQVYRTYKMKMPEIYEGYCSDEGNLMHYSPAVGVEVHKSRLPIDILRLRRVFRDKPSKSTWFKSPKKIKNYVPIRIIVEYL